MLKLSNIALPIDIIFGETNWNEKYNQRLNIVLPLVIGSLELLKNYSNTNMRRRVYLHLTTQRALQKDDEITIRYTPVFEVGISLQSS